MNALGIAIWGLGNHARNRILPALSSIQELSLIGVCSRTEKKVVECAQQWNCLGWTDPNEMLNNPNVDIVYLATPIGVHFNLAIQALKAGKHVWCEKPLTCNYEDTKTLVRLARESKKMLAEAFMYLHHPQFSKVKNLVNDGKIGQVHSVICRFGIPILKDPGFRHDPSLCGGALWDVATYTVSAVLALFPKPPYGYTKCIHLIFLLVSCDRLFGPFQCSTTICLDRANVNALLGVSFVMVDPDAIVDLELIFNGATKLQPDPTYASLPILV